MKTTLDKATNAMRIATYAGVLIMLPVLIFKVTPLLDRAVTVLENMDKRVDDTVKGLTPLGKEGVNRGVRALQSVDSKQVGKDLTDAIRRKLGGEKK